MFERARQCGLSEGAAAASVDATGLESRYISRHFLRRSGRMKRFRRYVKLTILCQNRTHMIAGATVRAGPSNDSPDLPPVVRGAARRIEIDTLYADAAYDCEAHHCLCRDELGIAKTVIPINDRGRPDAIPQTRYRRQMKAQFPHEESGQRWQVESVISRFKRLLGSSLRARTDPSRTHECYLRVLTHNLMIL